MTEDKKPFLVYDCVLCNLSKQQSFNGAEMKSHLKTKDHLLSVMQVDHCELYEKYKDDKSASATLLFKEICKFGKPSNIQVLTSQEKYDKRRKNLAALISKKTKKEHGARRSSDLSAENSTEDSKVETESDEMDFVDQKEILHEKASDTVIRNMQTFVRKLATQQKERNPSNVVFVLDERDIQLQFEEFGDCVKMVRAANLDCVIESLQKEDQLGKGSLIIVLCGVNSLVSSKVADFCKKMNCPNPLMKYTVNTVLSSDALISKALNLHKFILDNTTNDKVMLCDLIPANVYSKTAKKCDNNHTLQREIYRTDLFAKYLRTIDAYNEFVENHSRTMDYKSWYLLTNSFPPKDCVKRPLKISYDYSKIDNKQASSYIMKKTKEFLKSLKVTSKEEILPFSKLHRESSPKISSPDVALFSKVVIVTTSSYVMFMEQFRDSKVDILVLDLKEPDNILKFRTQCESYPANTLWLSHTGFSNICRPAFSDLCSEAYPPCDSPLPVIFPDDSLLKNENVAYDIRNNVLSQLKAVRPLLKPESVFLPLPPLPPTFIKLESSKHDRCHTVNSEEKSYYFIDFSFIDHFSKCYTKLSQVLTTFSLSEINNMNPPKISSEIYKGVISSWQHHATILTVDDLLNKVTTEKFREWSNFVNKVICDCLSSVNKRTSKDDQVLENSKMECDDFNMEHKPSLDNAASITKDSFESIDTEDSVASVSKETLNVKSQDLCRKREIRSIDTSSSRSGYNSAKIYDHLIFISCCEQQLNLVPLETNTHHISLVKVERNFDWNSVKAKLDSLQLSSFNNILFIIMGSIKFITTELQDYSCSTRNCKEDSVKFLTMGSNELYTLSKTKISRVQNLIFNIKNFLKSSTVVLSPFFPIVCVRKPSISTDNQHEYLHQAAKRCNFLVTGDYKKWTRGVEDFGDMWDTERKFSSTNADKNIIDLINNHSEASECYITWRKFEELEINIDTGERIVEKSFFENLVAAACPHINLKKFCAEGVIEKPFSVESKFDIYSPSISQLPNLRKRVFQKIVIITDCRYFGYMNKFKNQKIEIHVFDFSHSDIISDIKAQINSQPPNTLWLYPTGIFSIAHRLECQLCVRSRPPCTDPLHIVLPDDKELKDFIQTAHNAAFSLMKEVNSILESDSSFVILPPIPPNLLKLTKRNHNSLHSIDYQGRMCYISSEDVFEKLVIKFTDLSKRVIYALISELEKLNISSNQFEIYNKVSKTWSNHLEILSYELFINNSYCTKKIDAWFHAVNNFILECLNLEVPFKIDPHADFDMITEDISDTITENKSDVITENKYIVTGDKYNIRNKSKIITESKSDITEAISDRTGDKFDMITEDKSDMISEDKSNMIIGDKSDIIKYISDMISEVKSSVIVGEKRDKRSSLIEITYGKVNVAVSAQPKQDNMGEKRDKRNSLSEIAYDKVDAAVSAQPKQDNMREKRDKRNSLTEIAYGKADVAVSAQPKQDNLRDKKDKLSSYEIAYDKTDVAVSAQPKQDDFHKFDHIVFLCYEEHFHLLPIEQETSEISLVDISSLDFDHIKEQIECIEPISHSKNLLIIFLGTIKLFLNEFVEDSFCKKGDCANPLRYFNIKAIHTDKLVEWKIKEVQNLLTQIEEYIEKASVMLIPIIPVECIVKSAINIKNHENIHKFQNDNNNLCLLLGEQYRWNKLFQSFGIAWEKEISTYISKDNPIFEYIKDLQQKNVAPVIWQNTKLSVNVETSFHMVRLFLRNLFSTACPSIKLKDIADNVASGSEINIEDSVKYDLNTSKAKAGATSPMFSFLRGSRNANQNSAPKLTYASSIKNINETGVANPSFNNKSLEVDKVDVKIDKDEVKTEEQKASPSSFKTVQKKVIKRETKKEEVPLHAVTQGLAFFFRNLQNKTLIIGSGSNTESKVETKKTLIQSNDPVDEIKSNDDDFENNKRDEDVKDKWNIEHKVDVKRTKVRRNDSNIHSVASSLEDMKKNEESNNNNSDSVICSNYAAEDINTYDRALNSNPQYPVRMAESYVSNNQFASYASGEGSPARNTAQGGINAPYSQFGESQTYIPRRESNVPFMPSKEGNSACIQGVESSAPHVPDDNTRVPYSRGVENTYAFGGESRDAFAADASCNIAPVVGTESHTTYPQGAYAFGGPSYSSYFENTERNVTYPPPGGSNVAYPPPGGSNVAYPPPGGSNVAYPPPGGSNVAYPPPSGNNIAYPPPGGRNVAYPPPGGSNVAYPPPGGSNVAYPPPGGSNIAYPSPGGSNVTYTPPGVSSVTYPPPGVSSVTPIPNQTVYNSDVEKAFTFSEKVHVTDDTFNVAHAPDEKNNVAHVSDEKSSPPHVSSKVEDKTYSPFKESHVTDTRGKKSIAASIPSKDTSNIVPTKEVTTASTSESKKDLAKDDDDDDDDDDVKELHIDLCQNVKYAAFIAKNADEKGTVKGKNIEKKHVLFNLDISNVVKSQNVSFEHAYIIGDKKPDILQNKNNENITFIKYELSDVTESYIPTFIKSLGEVKPNSACFLIFNLPALTNQTYPSFGCKTYRCKNPIPCLWFNISQNNKLLAVNVSVVNKVMELMSLVTKLSALIPVIVLPFYPSSIHCDSYSSASQHELSHSETNICSYVVDGTKENWESFATTLKKSWNHFVERTSKTYFSSDALDKYIKKELNLLIFEDRKNTFSTLCSEVSKWESALKGFLQILIVNFDDKFDERVTETAVEETVNSSNVFVVIWNFPSSTENAIYFAFKEIDSNAITHNYQNYHLIELCRSSAEQIPNVLKDLQKVDDKLKYCVVAEDNYVLLHFKTKECMGNCKGDQHLCRFYHDVDDKRRTPISNAGYIYNPVICSFPKATAGECMEKGSGCTLCHNSFEFYFHPSKYQTIVCPDKQKSSCQRQPYCNYAHENTCEMFYNKEWQDSVIFGAEHSLNYIMGAIRGLTKLPPLQNGKILFLSPSMKFLNAIKALVIKIFHNFNISNIRIVVLGENAIQPDCYNVFLSTPSNLFNAHQYLFATKLCALIVDDIMTMVNDYNRKLLLLLLKLKLKDTSAINKVFVCNEYDASATEHLQKLFEIPLHEVKEKESEEKKVRSRSASRSRSHSPGTSKKKSRSRSGSAKFSKNRSRSGSRSAKCDRSRSRSRSGSLKFVKKRSKSRSRSAKYKTRSRSRSGSTKLRAKFSGYRTRSPATARGRRSVSRSRDKRSVSRSRDKRSVSRSRDKRSVSRSRDKRYRSRSRGRSPRDRRFFASSRGRPYRDRRFAARSRINRRSRSRNRWSPPSRNRRSPSRTRNKRSRSRLQNRRSRSLSRNWRSRSRSRNRRSHSRSLNKRSRSRSRNRQSSSRLRKRRSPSQSKLGNRSSRSKSRNRPSRSRSQSRRSPLPSKLQKRQSCSQSRSRKSRSKSRDRIPQSRSPEKQSPSKSKITISREMRSKSPSLPSPKVSKESEKSKKKFQMDVEKNNLKSFPERSPSLPKKGLKKRSLSVSISPEPMMKKSKTEESNPSSTSPEPMTKNSKTGESNSSFTSSDSDTDSESESTPVLQKIDQVKSTSSNRASKSETSEAKRKVVPQIDQDTQSDPLSLLLGGELYNEFLKEKKKITLLQDEEYEVYANFPELHDNYKAYFKGFCATYAKRFGDKKGGKQRDAHWKEFWSQNLNNIKKKELNLKIEKLIRHYKQRAGTRDQQTEDRPLKNVKKIKSQSSVELKKSGSDKVSSKNEAISLSSTVASHSSASNVHCSEITRKQDIVSTFSVEGTLKLLEEVSSKLGMLGPAIRTLVDSARERGIESSEALNLFSEEENGILLQLVTDKLKVMKSSISQSDIQLLSKSINHLLEYAKKPRRKINLDLKSIAVASLNKTSDFTLDLIKTAFAYEGHKKPTKEELNNVYYKICSLHAEMTSAN